jgi:hypothetical protein
MEITLPIATWALPQILQVLARSRLMMEAVQTNLQTTTVKPFPSTWSQRKAAQLDVLAML